VKRLIGDAIQDSWAGSKPPEEAKAVRESFKNAKKDFDLVMKKYTLK
jgi:hypothetical protein